jgi:hypothetical protein
MKDNNLFIIIIFCFGKVANAIDRRDAPISRLADRKLCIYNFIQVVLMFGKILAVAESMFFVIPNEELPTK